MRWASAALVAWIAASSALAQSLDPCRSAVPFSRAEDVQLAIERHSEAIRAGGGARAYLERGVCRERLGQLEPALEDLDMALRLEPGNPLIWQARGEIDVRLGRHRDAVRDFGAAVERDPKSVVARHGRAASLTLLGEPERAIEDLDEALRLDPRYAPALLGRGEAHARAGRHARALEDFNAYIAAAPDDAYARFRRGLSYVRSGQLEPGIADFSEAIRLDARLLSAYIERSRAYVRTGRPERAVNDLMEAVGLAPRYAPAHNELAWLLATSSREGVRDGKSALEHARAAAELTAWGDPGVLDTYAAALAETGQFEQAASWQERAIDLPGFTESMREQARVRLQQYRAGKPFRAPL